MFFTSKPFLLCVLGFILLLMFGQVFYGIDISKIAPLGAMARLGGALFVAGGIMIGTIWVFLFIVKNVWRSIS